MTKYLVFRDSMWDIYRTDNQGGKSFIGTVPDTEIDSLIDKWRGLGVDFTISAD